ncbi:hypothetical protein CEXT_531361 [Caerostris extrusa]|uniref:Uncharacterized protein n=1 Tax=Caerostris extrusa TaxID=172846 RepID=A0AAV4Y4G4_CAEEX|nr:hypothetical protein CEXT_531361 [Caerostris extrusa]
MSRLTAARLWRSLGKRENEERDFPGSVGLKRENGYRFALCGETLKQASIIFCIHGRLVCPVTTTPLQGTGTQQTPKFTRSTTILEMGTKEEDAFPSPTKKARRRSMERFDDCYFPTLLWVSCLSRGRTCRLITRAL